MTTPARQELRDLIAAKIDEKMRSERMDDHFDGRDYADAVMKLFYEVADEWQDIDMREMGDQGPRYLAQRSLLARIPREAHHRYLGPDRPVSP